MKKTNDTVKVGFSKGWDMLPAGKQKETRIKLMEDCGWGSLATFYAKKDGKVALRKTEIPVVQKHFEAFNLNAFTGDYLTDFQD